MLEIEVTRGFEKRIQDLVDEYSTPVTNETFDKVLGDYMSVLHRGNEGEVVYADSMTFGKEGQEEKHTEMYKPSNKEIKRALEEGNSTLMLTTPNSGIYCLNYVKVGDKGYLQLLTPNMAESIRERYRHEMEGSQAKANVELTVWDKICNFFSNLFQRRPGEAVARKEAYRKFSENMQKAVEEYDKTATEAGLGNFGRRASLMNQKRKYLEEDYQKKRDLEETLKYQKEVEESRKKEEIAQQKKQKMREQLLKELEEQRKQKELNPQEAEPIENEADIEAEKKAEEEARNKLAEEQRENARQEAQKKADEEWNKKVQDKKAELDAAGDIYENLKKTLEDQNATLATWNEHLDTIIKAYDLKKAQEEALDKQITDAKLEISILRNRAVEATNEKHALDERGKELNLSKDDLAKEKQALDHFGLEYNAAKERFEQINADWEMVEREGTVMSMSPNEYLEHTYKLDLERRKAEFDQEKAARDKQISEKLKDISDLQANIKEVKSKHGMWSRTDEEKEHLNYLESMLKTAQNEHKQLENAGKQALKDFDAKDKELQKEYLKPTAEKLKETEDFQKKGLEEFNAKKDDRTKAQKQMNSMKAAFDGQQKVYQKKLSDFETTEKAYNADKENFMPTYVALVKANNDAVQQQKARREQHKELKEENEKTWKVISAAQKERTQLSLKRGETYKAIQKQQTVVNNLEREYRQMSNQEPPKVNLPQAGPG